MAHLMTINDTFQNVWPERWLTTQKGDHNGLITEAVSETGTGTKNDQDMDEWVVWFCVEPFTLHLNRDRD